MWENKKPDKDGVWLWRLPHNSDRDVMSVIRVDGDNLVEMGGYPPKRYPIDIWWEVLPKTEVYYVEGA